MSRVSLSVHLLSGAIVGVLACASAVALLAQAPAAPPRTSATPRDLAPLDFTGYWVSVVTEDWRYRMVMPLQGDYGSVPLTPEGRRVADTWKPAQAGGCEAYGVGAGMRAPGRLHITWEDDRTLKIEMDAGQQTRWLHFDAAGAGSAKAPPYERAAEPPTWQGTSVAMWDGPPDVIDVLRTGGFDQLNRGTGQAARRLAWTPLKVVTTNHKAGWLRANGVPYSGQASITEHFMRYALPDRSEWLTVRTVVDDPIYLVQPFMTSTNFKREADGAKWNPRPCRE